MSPERAAVLLPIIQAFSTGKSIHMRKVIPHMKSAGWIDCFQPCWRGGTDYRVKPYPKVIENSITVSNSFTGKYVRLCAAGDYSNSLKFYIDETDKVVRVEFNSGPGVSRSDCETNKSVV